MLPSECGLVKLFFLIKVALASSSASDPLKISFSPLFTCYNQGMAENEFFRPFLLATIKVWLKMNFFARFHLLQSGYG
jgi:hypothetical protein